VVCRRSRFCDIGRNSNSTGRGLAEENTMRPPVLLILLSIFFGYTWISTDQYRLSDENPSQVSPAATLYGQLLSATNSTYQT